MDSVNQPNVEDFRQVIQEWERLQAVTPLKVYLKNRFPSLTQETLLELIKQYYQ